MFGPYIHQIDPILFDIAGVHVWWYGLGFAIGFLEIHLFLRRGHGRFHLSLRDVWSLSLFIAVGVLVGGRLVEITFDEWPFYREHLGLIPAYWLGGMATHGLMFGGAVGAGLFALLYRNRSCSWPTPSSFRRRCSWGSGDSGTSSTAKSSGP